MPDTWKKVAEALAQRMEYQAWQCPENHQPLDPDCPFCDDTIALERYVDFAKPRGGWLPSIYVLGGSIFTGMPTPEGTHTDA